MRIFITGKHGQVGFELQRSLAPLGQITAVDVEDVDLLDHHALRAAIRQAAPDLIVNPAAYTAVDQAEKESELARAINATAPAIIAEEAKRAGAAMIHYSTDYVYDGSSAEPYAETAPTNPLGVYGATKLEGDRAIENAGVPYLILRTSWVYATRGKNFLLTILRLASEREQLRIIDDQYGAPTWARLIAECTGLLVAQLHAPRDNWEKLRQLSGVYHLTAGGRTTWCEFARAILADPEAHCLAPKPVVCREIVPIRTEDYPLPARRPQHSVLSNAKLKATFGLAMPDWRTQLHYAVSLK